MRDRSETIYAENEEQFKEILCILDRRKEQHRKRKSKFVMVDTEYDSEFGKEFDSFKNYQLTIIEPTLEEKEKQEELNLLETINNMNKNYRKLVNYHKENTDPNEKFSQAKTIDRSNEYDLKSRSYSESFCSTSNDDKDNFINSFNSNNKRSITSKASTCINTLSLENSNISSNDYESIMNQNLINFDHILKFIVIGDKAVGKSLLIDNFVSSSINLERRSSNYICSQIQSSKIFKYIPTDSLEIKKSFIEIQDKTVKVEFLDTNLSVLNSSIIKTYYKISNGFILIADYEKLESLKLIEKQIENIFNFSNFHNNIILIINKKQNKSKLIHTKKSSMNDITESHILTIQEKYNICPIYLDLANLKKVQKKIRLFIQTVFFRKLGKILTLDKNKNKTYIHESELNKKTKKTSNSNSNTPLNSPLNNIDSKYPSVSLTQKRTHSQKRNLSDVFNQLGNVTIQEKNQ